MKTGLTKEKDRFLAHAHITDDNKPADAFSQHVYEAIKLPEGNGGQPGGIIIIAKKEYLITGDQQDNEGKHDGVKEQLADTFILYQYQGTAEINNVSNTP